MKKLFRLVILICGLWIMVPIVIGSGLVSAQGPPPPPPPPGPLGGGGTSAPIDNEVVLLLLAASVFGAWKLRKKKAVSL